MIVTHDLHKAYGGLNACDKLSISFEPGSTTAIVGPNGAGKSTLVQLLSGVVQADSGRITLGDTDITALPAAHRFALGMVRTFQTARVFPGLNVMDSVLIGAYHGLLYETRPYSVATTVGDACASLLQLASWRERHHEAQRRALASIELFGDRLKTRLKNFTFSLSYANRRRVEIARALASQPKFLMLDEPTAGMNPTETQELADLLRHLKESRPEMTLVFIEHKMHIVRQMSKRVIVMDAGQVIADGTPDEALNDPAVVDAYLGTGGKHAAPA